MDALNLLQGNIIDLLGLQHLPEDRKQQLLAQMSQVLQDRLTDRLIESMSKDQRDQFERLLNSDPTPDQVDAFFKATVPDYVELAMDEVVKFKKELVSEVATVRQIAAAV